jgi:hypothetical protein
VTNNTALIGIEKCITSKGTMLQAGGSRVRDLMRCDFSIYLIMPAALGPAVHLAFNRNEYCKQKNNDYGEYSAV